MDLEKLKIVGRHLCRSFHHQKRATFASSTCPYNRSSTSKPAISRKSEILSNLVASAGLISRSKEITSKTLTTHSIPSLATSRSSSLSNRSKPRIITKIEGLGHLLWSKGLTYRSLSRNRISSFNRGHSTVFLLRSFHTSPINLGKITEVPKPVPDAAFELAGAGEASVKQKTPPPKQSLFSLYMKLSKARLGAMVVLSTVFGFLLAPGVFDPVLFGSAVIGTSFTVASANSINQYLEVEYDSLMKRTRNRPLPAGDMSMNHALAFGWTTGALGTVILGTAVNPLAAGLAFSNIILYTLVYTPMKRVHPINTAIGAVVGAIPPLIGWAAQTGGLEAGAWVSFLVLALWQMPHFHALSWPLRHDYAGAGYKMLCTVAGHKVARNTLIYCISMLALGPFAALTGLASWSFALLGSIPTIIWIKYAYQFYKDNSNVSARAVFKMSLYWLPTFFALLCLCLAPNRDIDTIEDDVIAIQQQHQQHSLDSLASVETIENPEKTKL